MNESLLLLLTGPVIFIVTFFFYRFPPRTINHLYGYRTPASMRNQETWEFANRYSSRWLFLVGILMNAVQAGFLLILPPVTTVLLALGVLIVGIIAMMVKVEVELRRRFPS